MAHKKAGGSTALGRDSQSKRLGVKLFGGQIAKIGNIIIKQRGTKWHPGKNVRRGNDDRVSMPWLLARSNSPAKKSAALTVSCISENSCILNRPRTRAVFL